MPPAPNLLLALGVTVSLAMAVIVMSLGAVLSRLRKLARPMADTAKIVGHLAQRQEALETLVEALGTSTTPPPTPGHPAPTRRVDRSKPTAVSRPTLISVPNLAASPSNTTEAMAELGRRFGAIWAMADMGLAPETIAREMGQPIGQVELILGLRRPLATGGGPPGGHT